VVGDAATAVPPVDGSVAGAADGAVSPTPSTSSFVAGCAGQAFQSLGVTSTLEVSLGRAPSGPPTSVDASPAADGAAADSTTDSPPAEDGSTDDGSGDDGSGDDGSPDDGSASSDGPSEGGE
jgi:hypothetical protein